MKLHYLAVVSLVICAAIAAPAAHADKKEVAFETHTIVASGLRGGYQVVVTDLNKDGKPDVIAVAQGLPELAWYENPGWERHVIASGMSQMINAAPYDVDGDGIPELALAQGFTSNAKTSVGIVSVLTHGADVTQPWTIKESIARRPRTASARLTPMAAAGSGS
jgi:hypothetical protein